jgi:hypothetical protein
MNELLRDVHRRLPAGQRLMQEAFTTDHRHAVMVKLGELSPDTFYFFDAMTAQAFSDAAMELAARSTGGKLTVVFPFFGECQAQRHRLQHVARKLAGIRVLAVGRPPLPGDLPSRVEFTNIDRNLLTRFRLVLNQGRKPFGFVCREAPARGAGAGRGLGFFTTDAETVDALAGDVELLRRGLSRRLGTFDQLQTLHQSTQRVARELESYSRRMELAVQRARRRPDLLTPERFERIVTQAIAKMEQLKEIPRNALRTISEAGGRRSAANAGSNKKISPKFRP